MPKVYVVNRPRENKFGWTPIAVMVCCMIASEMSPVVRILRWERNFEEGDRDRRKGWYMPVALEMRKA